MAGTLGTAEGLAPVPGGAGPEADQAVRNIGRILLVSAATLDQVVEVNVPLVDMSEFGAMNEAYALVFPADPPARITVGVAALALGASVEIDCVAWSSSGGRD